MEEPGARRGARRGVLEPRQADFCSRRGRQRACSAINPPCGVGNRAGLTAASGLVAAYSQLERARALAADGDFRNCRGAYQQVEAQLRSVAAGVADAGLRQSWVIFMRALQEEQELVAAWEQECEELAAWGAGGGTQQEVLTPLGGGRAPQLGAAFNIDPHSFEVEELPPPRQHSSAASSEAQERDPDVWAPVDLPASSGGGGPAPLGSAYSREQRSRREREEANERQRRDSITPTASASKRNPMSGVKSKVNTGAKRAPPPGDAKCAIMDQMMDRFGGPDQELIQQLSRDVLQQVPGVTWEDIAGLDGAKEVLKENVSMPLLMKDLFSQIPILRPLKGVLLFGPPGTGKTMLAKAVATAGTTAGCKTNFMNVSASTLASKYRGESEKLVRFLFEIARAAQPCVIFIDEIDSLCSSRGGQNEHEASRRMKTELLTQIDGMHSATPGGGPAPRVMVLAATNYPWDIDEALRRRLEKRIYIPLPHLAERAQLLNLCLEGTRAGPDVDLHDIALQTDGFSGADISNLCREAASIVVRRKLAGRSLGSMGVSSVAAMEAEIKQHLLTQGVDRQAFHQALRNTNPSCSATDVERHRTFAQTYGCT